MNRTKIEWVTNPDGSRGWTWNPVTGCLHGCAYCYARAIYKRFGWSFEPTFHEQRLYEPVDLPKDRPQRVFVCSVADLFGDWVECQWVDDVLEIVRTHPLHEFYFLTKNPKRYQEFSFPPNARIGVTVTNQADADARIPLLLQTPAAKRFVSVEPMLGAVDLTAIDYDRILAAFAWKGCLDWVIIGSQTGPGAIPPLRQWVTDLTDQCQASGVPVFQKDNLANHYALPMIQEWPKH